MSFTNYLKEVSQGPHDQLEKTPLVLKLLSSDLDQVTYERWLQLTWALHNFCLQQGNEQALGFCFYNLKEKCEWLESDLGESLNTMPRMNFPKPQNKAEYLSLLYTVEGSSMGVHAIYHLLERNGSLQKLRNRNFLENQVQLSPRLWRQDKMAIDQCAGESAIEAKDYIISLFESIATASRKLLN